MHDHPPLPDMPAAKIIQSRYVCNNLHKYQ